MHTVPSVRHPSRAGGRPWRAAVAVVLALTFVVPACAPERSEEPSVMFMHGALAAVGQGFNLNASDLRFIYEQIRISEHHAAGGALLGPGPNQVGDPRLPFGLRTVDGTLNNLMVGQEAFGAADLVFPRLLPATYRPAENGTSYAQKKGIVQDSAPRIVSNLIADQTMSNPAAVAAAGAGALPDAASGTLPIPNVAPDEGLSAPYNALFTFFGQFFDHGLDLVTKGGGMVFVPLQPDDPLYVAGSPTNFMVLSRAKNLPGPDGVLGDDPATAEDESADDVQEATNVTTPFVDQNQTYTSHPSHQVFLREYRLELGRPVSTGRLLDGAIAGNIASWAEVKAQAATLLGIALEDADVLDVPLLATDPYGRFLRGPNGFPLVAFPGGAFVEGDPVAPVPVAGALRTGHAFLDDIAHQAVPVGDHDGSPATPPQPLQPDLGADVVNDGDPATYDDELLGAHFITGDGRGNENIGLTAVHVIFHGEHNRLVADIHGLVNTLLAPEEIAAWGAVDPSSGWDYGERLFQAARFVTEMQYQHIVFEEFARKVQPQVNVFSGYHTEIDPAIAAEFAHVVYRFGHSMLTESVGRIRADGTLEDIPLFDAFLDPLGFNDGGIDGTLTAEQAAGGILQSLAHQVGSEIDEFVTEALRNKLLGLPLDLATINIARGRSEGVPPLNEARRRFYEATANTQLVPYQSWADFALGLRNADSLVNFVAAYGTHPSIVGTVAERRVAATRLVQGDPLTDPLVPADHLDFMQGVGTWANVEGRSITGVEEIDFWMGGMAEKQAPFGGLLGSTFNFVFERQLEALQDGDRFYYLTRTAGLNLLVQLEGNSFAELIMRNSEATRLPADAFSRPDFLFDLAFLGTSGAILDDPGTPQDESTMTELFRMPDGTIRYSGPAHVVFNGTDDPLVVDRMWASDGDDTIRGNGGRDVMEGGAGNDNFIGGEGDDVLTDAFGDDVLKGGDGDDAMSSGPGFDLNQGGLGNDFIVGGSDPTEHFGGPGNDLVFGGDSFDTVFGDDGDDWIEGGAGADLLQGDNGAPFQNDPNQPGHDVIIGNGGDDDYDAEGGDDILVAGPGIERNEGMLGFDWVTHKSDPQPADADMRFTGLLPPTIENLRDRFDLVEGLSGWIFSDVLRGDDSDAGDMVGNELGAEGIARIQGLETLLGGATSFTGGNIILGGPGSDVIEGRGGNDLIDGDAWLNVQLRAPDPATADLADTKLVDSMLALRADVFAGRIDPGEIAIVRSVVLTGVSTSDVDTAVFSGARAEYTIGVNPDGSVTVDHGGGIDGLDTLRNVELLAFTDGTIPAPTNVPATGTVTISSTTPVEDQLLTVSDTIVDPDGIDAATFVHTWQAETAPNTWTPVGTGSTFTPGDPEVGLRLRVVATFQDLATEPNSELVASDPTSPVLGVNDPATGAPVLSDTTPEVGAPVSAITSGIQDADGLGTFRYQWMANGVPILNAILVSFTPTSAQVGAQLTVSVSYTDGQGFAETLTSAPSAAVAPASGAILSVTGTFDFGRQRVGSSRIGELDVTNTGTAPLQIASVQSSGPPFINPTVGDCTAPLVPGDRCRITVTFRPTAPGTYTGTLTVTSNATNSPTLVRLTGSAR